MISLGQSIFTAVLGSVLVLEDPGQLPPANPAEWQQAMDAIVGGVPVDDAILARPIKYRELAAEQRQLWETLAQSAWSATASSYLLSFPDDFEYPESLSGTLSDGTDYTLVVLSWDFHSTESLASAASDSSEADYIRSIGVNAAFVEGQIDTAFGSAVIRGICVMAFDDPNAVEYLLPYAVIAVGSGDSFLQAVGDRGGDLVSNPNQALEDCLDDAFDRHHKCGKDILLDDLIPGLLTGPGFFWYAFRSLWKAGDCDVQYADDIESCLDDNGYTWWYDRGTYYYLRR